MNNPKLEPCPFCGSTNIETVAENLAYRCIGLWKVRCMDCFATVGEPSLFGKPDTEYQAIKMWNRRGNDEEHAATV